MRRSLAAALLIGALFDTTAFTEELTTHPFSRSEPCPVETLFEEARAIAATIPVEHSAELTPYTEMLVYPKYKQPRTRTDFVRRSIPLVLLNTFTCELAITSVTRVIKRRSLPTVLSTDDSRFIVFVEERAYGAVWNWWNSSLHVLAPEGWIVASLHWKERSTGQSIVYTPGSGDLIISFPSLPDVGREHFRSDHDAAAKRLANVPSRAVPGMSVESVIMTFFPRLLETIVSIEHADDHEVAAYRNGEFPVSPIDRPFAVIAGNPETAFAFTRSKAGARGMMQVMPSTCEDMRNKYLSAQIPPGCFEMPHPHVVELTTAMLVLDYHLSIISQRLRRQGETPEEFAARPEMKLLLRAAYNTGPGRVSTAVRSQKNWSARLLSETRGYLVKAFGLDEPLK